MEKERLLALITKFKDKKIAVIGDLMLDSYLYGKVERTNPERPGYPLLRVERKEHRIGGAANVAANCAVLGACVTLLGTTGRDTSAAILKERCEHLGITPTFLPEGKTLVKQRRIESTHNDYLGRDDFGEAQLTPLSEKNAEKIYQALHKEKPDAIVLSDYNKKIFKSNLAERIITWAQQYTIPVIADPKPANALVFKKATVLCPNLKEGREMLNDITKEKTLHDIAQQLKETFNVAAIALKCGADGIVSYDGTHHHTPTEAKDLVDVTGAGDTVAATLTLALTADATLKEASYLANHAAGIAVEKMGTYHVSQKELVKRLNGTNKKQ